MVQLLQSQSSPQISSRPFSKNMLEEPARKTSTEDVFKITGFFDKFKGDSQGVNSWQIRKMY